jgi:hypothetical protein
MAAVNILVHCPASGVGRLNGVCCSGYVKTSRCMTLRPWVLHIILSDRINKSLQKEKEGIKRNEDNSNRLLSINKHRIF